MSLVLARNIEVEFPIYDVYMRSLRHRFGLGRLARSFNRIKARELAVGGYIDSGYSGRTVVKALSGISLTLKDGDRLGLLGHNGSGKTTLLRTLAGIYEPVRGEIITQGRVMPLFDLQLGMDPDATGVENILLRGRMLDLTEQQLKDSFEDIANFTELGDYLYMPIRTYSTGMLVRLAFAISTAITPDILILDEMIGAGDAAFLDRAQHRVQNFIANTGILIIASHSPSILRQWCNRGLVLEHGKVVADGPIDEVIRRYERSAA